MTRHGRNATNSAVYTYHERKKDAEASGYGTDRCRLSKDSLKGYDCCSLTLQPCANPVVTPQGWLFDKEPLLEYILAKKKEYTRKLKEYERQKSQESKESQELAEAERESRLMKFQSSEKSILTAESSRAGPPSKKLKLPSFWVPGNTPENAETKRVKPDKTVYCPMSRKPVRLKDLVDVKFKLLNPEDKNIISKVERYICPVTSDVLSNSTPCAVLKPTGDVVTVECVNKIIKKDMIHPLTGITLKDSDIIYLQRGGTGYAAANSQLEATHYRPNLAIA